MKKILLPLFGALLLTGCTHRYVITTTTGRAIDTKTKPKLHNGFYVFKDALGRDQMIHSGRVAEISAASIARREKEKQTFNFSPGTQNSK